MQRTYPIPTPRKPIPTVANAKAPLFTPSRLAGWLLLAGGLTFFLISVTVSALIVGSVVIYASGRILPGVSTAGVRVGGSSVDSAADILKTSWGQIAVRDGNRLWSVAPEQLGIALDFNATAIAAQRTGRGDGAMLSAMISDSITPVVNVDRLAAEQGLEKLAQTVDSPAENATIHLVEGGQVVAVPAITGRSLDVKATLDHLSAAPGSQLSNGILNLVMVTTQPTITDASAVLNQARALLDAPLTLNAFDPIQNQTATWSVPSQTWSAWLTTAQSASGVGLAIEASPLTNYLDQQNQGYSNGRYIDVGRSVAAVSAAVAAGTGTVTLLVLHKPVQYTVTNNDTIGSIAWAHGIPMWRIAKANPTLNMDALNPGEKITIPSQDDMLPLPVVVDKRIVVSIPKQHMWVYENGILKWDWIASTGIQDSPTAPGIFQIQSHVVNAYAGNWNLWMPNFMSIYEAVPDFWNGIHGFPTRGGQGLLWQGDLGHPVTFGCILVSSANAQSLYNWAQDGVVVEIQG